MSAPGDRLLPWTVRIAFPELPEAATCAVPRTMFPRVNETLPADRADPAVIVAVNWVVALWAITEGLATTTRLVEIRTGCTVIATAVEAEPAKPALPA